MGRGATKSIGNVWFEARKAASLYNDKLNSREGAAELLGMSSSSVADAELGLTKCMPVDKAVLMADLYHAPHLLNYYCLNECPIGCRHAITDDVYDLTQITLKLLNLLRDKNLIEIRDTVVEIAEDGKISEDEMADYEKVKDYFTELGKAISAFGINRNDPKVGGSNGE